MTSVFGCLTLLSFAGASAVLSAKELGGRSLFTEGPQCDARELQAIWYASLIVPSVELLLLLATSVARHKRQFGQQEAALSNGYTQLGAPHEVIKAIYTLVSD